MTEQPEAPAPEIVFGDERRPLSYEQVSALMNDLNRNRISQRSQGRSTLSYLEAWDVKRTLIRVFGFGNFSAEATDVQVLSTERDVPNARGGTTAFRVTAMATVRLTIHQTGAVYTETAAASQAGADIGEVTDFAIKTAESDALKRCAIYLGTQFGLSLYDNGATGDIVGVILEPGQAEHVARKAAESQARHQATLAGHQRQVSRALGQTDPAEGGPVNTDGM